MSRTGIQYLVSLREGKGDKETLSNELAHILYDAADPRAMHSLALSILRGAQPKCLTIGEIIANPLSRIRCTTYLTDKSTPSVALGIAFLQNHKTPSPHLDETIAEAIVSHIEASNLDKLVTDVTVNTVQYINGTKDIK